MNELNRSTCALCQEAKTLLDSHLTPKWVYKRLRRAGNGTDNPILIANGTACMTSSQEKKILLCSECEHRFSLREDYVARLLDGTPSKILQYLIPLDKSMAGAVELNQNEIDTKKISYFAISIIWRSCFIDGGCRLGKYQEQFRRYLYEKEAFPHFAALSMTITDPAKAGDGGVYNLYTQPTSARDDQVWFHGFSLFGLTFRCYVGQALDLEWKEQICLAGDNKKKYALFLSANQIADHQGAINTLLNAKPRGKLREKSHK